MMKMEWMMDVAYIDAKDSGDYCPEPRGDKPPADDDHVQEQPNPFTDED